MNGRWQVGGADAGAIVCYVEPTSGDAHLWWSYKDASILVEAVNQHGDAKDLRGYFETVARFIAQGFVAP